MSLKNLLVAFNGTDSSEAALEAALAMHGRYGAHVTGIFAHASQLEQLAFYDWVPDALRQVLRERSGTGESGVEARFRALASQVPADRLHWITREGNSDETVANYARMYDMTIVGRRDTVIGNQAIDLHPDRIAERGGRAVLTVPKDWRRGIPDVALVAWDGQRAVTRALAEAMAILESKTRVVILRINDRSLRGSLPGIDVETALRRHGVTVDSRQVRDLRRSTADEIMAACEDTGAGLLVMGAHQRASFREEMVGSTTNRVLTHSAIPILIAH